MKFELIEFKENDDGSAELLLELDQEAKEFFINKGFNAALREAIDELKETK